MRVALIGPLPPRLGGATAGGVATHQLHLAEGLMAAGVDAPLLATNATAPARSTSLRVYCAGRGWTGLDHFARYAVALATERRRGSRREVLRNLLWYRRFLADVRPELIHVQHPLERCDYVRRVQRLEGWRTPLVVTAHSLLGEHPDEVIHNFMAPNLRAADHVIAVSDHIADEAAQLGVQRERISVIRSGVDVDQFQPRDRGAARHSLGIHDGAPHVLFVGNLEPRKQVDVLLRAMALVRNQVPCARLMVVGSGKSAGADDQTARLLQLATELDLLKDGAVHFVGAVDDAQLLEYYAAADVFALPSSSEAQGIVALEAMACGLPVVASAVGGLLGTIRDGETGFLVPSGDVDRWAERLTELLEDAERRKAIGAAARRAVERDFTWSQAVEASIDVYRDVLSRRRPRRLIAIPLGETSRTDVEAALDRQFGTARVTWVNRRDLRNMPARALLEIRRQSYDDAVLVAPDLTNARLRLTSLILAVPRASSRWRIELRGGREAWNLREHVAQNALPVGRHAVACALALLLAQPLLRILERWMRPRELRIKRPGRLLYLRSQLWLGLAGGGSVAHTAGVIDGLQQAGVAVSVVSSDRLPGVTAPTRVVRPEVWFDGWPRELEELAYNAKFFLAAHRAANDVRPHAIYQRHTAFNFAGALLSRILRLPLVLEFNSSELWKGRYWGGLRLAAVAGLVERINLRAADRVIVVSAVLRNQLVAAGVPAERIVVNPNGVDPLRFRPDLDAAEVRRRLRLEEEAVLVGFSGTFGAWHGIPTLATVLPMIIQARPTLHWLLMGDGPLRTLVDDAIARYGIADRVHRTGLVPHADMPTYLAACDILVSPHGRQADGEEFFGSPTKLFEYMASGRAIVASAVGQIAEVLADEHSALLVPPDDPDAVCRAIVRLLDDACLRERLGQAARQSAERCHTWRQNAERVLVGLAG